MSTVLVCLILGFCWSQILNFVGGSYSFKCHDVWRRWVGMDAAQIVKKLGPPVSKVPSDEEIKDGVARNVLYQSWRYEKPELKFEVRLSDNTVTEAYGDFRFQISDLGWYRH